MRFLLPIALSVTMAFALCGCETIQHGSVDTFDSTRTYWPEGETPPDIDVTPLSNYEDTELVAPAVNNRISNAYTRVIITSKLNEKPGFSFPPLKSEKGTLSGKKASRYVLGKKTDYNVSVKIKVGEYETVTPLLTLNHQDDRNGNQWTRQVSHELNNFSLFLVRPDGSANLPEITFTTVGSTNFDSTVAASTLQAALSTIQQLSPTAGVLTTLTTQASKEKAQAIDKVLQSFFSSGVKETHLSHRDLRKSSPNKGVSMKLWIPRQEGDWGSRDMQYVGEWTVSFDTPRPSIFSDWSICDDKGRKCRSSEDEAIREVHDEIKIGQVLSYTLLKSGGITESIRSNIVRRDWFTTASANFSNAASDQAVGEKLCQSIHTSVTDIGLNDHDANIIVRAVIEGVPLPTHHISSFSGKFCSDTIILANIRPSPQTAMEP